MAFFSTSNIKFPSSSSNNASVQGTFRRLSNVDLTVNCDIDIRMVALSSTGAISPGSWRGGGNSVRVEILYYTEAGTHMGTHLVVNKFFYQPTQSPSYLWGIGKMYSWTCRLNGTTTLPPASVKDMNWSDMNSTLEAAGYTKEPYNPTYLNEEPFGVRFLSDTAGSMVYSPRNIQVTDTWYNIYDRPGYGNKVSFSFTAPDGAVYYRVKISGREDTASTLLGEYIFPESAGMPTDETYILDIPSVGYRKPQGSGWQDTALYYINTPNVGWEDEADGFVKSGDWGKTK